MGLPLTTGLLDCWRAGLVQWQIFVASLSFVCLNYDIWVQVASVAGRILLVLLRGKFMTVEDLQVGFGSLVVVWI